MNFSVLSKVISEKSGHPAVGITALIVVTVWFLGGFPMHFSVVWHLIISTLAAVISIIMLFVIQNSQNRHTIAIQLKLDEIIRATHGAHNQMMDIEKLTDEDLARIQEKYGLLARQTKEEVKKGKEDTHTPDVRITIIEETGLDGNRP